MFTKAMERLAGMIAIRETLTGPEREMQNDAIERLERILAR
jgi:hypothetical protein